jgi:hypothetical protein
MTSLLAETGQGLHQGARLRLGGPAGRQLLGLRRRCGRGAAGEAVQDLGHPTPAVRQLVQEPGHILRGGDSIEERRQRRRRGQVQDLQAGVRLEDVAHPGLEALQLEDQGLGIPLPLDVASDQEGLGAGNRVTRALDLDAKPGPARSRSRQRDLQPPRPRLASRRQDGTHAEQGSFQKKRANRQQTLCPGRHLQERSLVAP